MMKNMERGPAVPPAARARAERNAARRQRRASTTPPGAFSTGFWIRGGLVALLAGFLAFSLQWPRMPFALYVGVAAAAIVLALWVGFRLIQRRIGTPG